MYHHSDRQAAAGHPLDLPLLRLELAFRLRDVCWLPPFRGSLWKSVLGPQLKRLDDTRRAPQGRPRSLYDWILSTGPGHALRRPLAGDPPHPLVIDAPPADDWAFLPPGSLLRLQLTLCGRLIDEWDSVVRAFAAAGDGGIGRAISENGKRGRARLISVHEVWRPDGERALWTAENGLREHPMAITPSPPLAGPVRVELVTPLRIERDGRPLAVEDIQPADLFSALARRQSGLAAAETGRPDDPNYFAALKAGWVAVRPLRGEVDWRNQWRWSRGEAEGKDCGGVTGHFDFDLTGRQDLFELLWRGQWTGAGQGALMGMGSIRLRPLASGAFAS